MNTVFRTALFGLLLGGLAVWSRADEPTTVPPAPAGSGTATLQAPVSAPVPQNRVYDDAGSVSMRDTIGVARPEPFGPTFHLDGHFGDGIGWRDNSYQFDMYYPWHLTPGESALFGVLQAAVTDEGKGYTNVGAGYRRYFGEYDRIFGVWGWYDYDDSHHNSYQRAGVSFESLGKYMDFRGNYYKLIDEDSNLVSSTISGDPFFQGNNIIFTRRFQFETPFDGGELEVGGPVPLIGRFGFYAHGGVYYVHSDTEDAVGGMGRINVAAADNIDVNVQIQGDKLFDTTTSVQVAWTLPDGVPTRWFKPRPVRERMNSQVQRRDRIAVRDTVQFEDEALLSLIDGNAIEVIHVDPNRTAGTGDGTFESPFGDIEDARLVNNADIDIFRIIPRDDASGTNLAVSTAFQLFDNQRVLGTSVEHLVFAVQGTFEFPGFTGDGPLPLVSNANNAPGDNVFLLANNDEISGIHVSGADSSGLVNGNGVGNVVPITDFNLNRNEFSDHVNAVVLNEVTGDGLFDQNAITGTPGISNDGFQLTNTAAGTLDLFLTANTSTANDGSGFRVEAGGASTINLEASENEATLNGVGFELRSTGGELNVAFDDNTASSNTSTTANEGGVVISADAGTTNVVSFSGNTLDANAGSGVVFAATTAAGGGTINIEGIVGNTITNNGTGNSATTADGIRLFAEGATSVIDAVIGDLDGAGNVITGNGAGTLGGGGIGVRTENGGTIQGAIVNNTIGQNAVGIFVDALSGTVDFGTLPDRMIDSNTIDGNTDAGIAIRMQGDSTGRFIITNNSIVNTTNGPNALLGGDAINIRTEGTAILSFLDISDNFLGSTAAGGAGSNAGSGIAFNFIQDSRAQDITIAGNDIRFNLVDGIQFRRSGDALLDNIIIDSNNITDNLGDGIDSELAGGDISIDGGGPLQIDFSIINNTVSNNGANGLRLFSTADADARYLIDNNTITSNAGNGIEAQTQFFAQVRGVWTDNLISSNGANGISLTDINTDGPSFDLVIGAAPITGFSNTITNNAFDGIHYETQENIPDAGGEGTVDINFNNIANNGGDGIDVHTVGTALAEININDNLIDDNAGRGVAFLASEISAILSVSNNNVIEFNGGDGWNMTTDFGSASLLTASLTDNIIRFNDGRGVNILNQWESDMDIEILGSTDPRPDAGIDSSLISGNGLNGILATNEADASRSLEAGLLTVNILKLLVQQTEISDNGQLATAPDDGNGVYIRVGTATSRSIGSAADVGRIDASLVDNHFSGNLNIDVVTESFTATVDPPVVNPFTDPGAFRADPVARLNFRLQGNVGQQIDVTRIGAFYDNDDPFKSVIQAGSPLFDSTTRRRNAQRVATNLQANGSPTTVAAAPAPTTTAFGSTNTVIFADGDLTNAIVQFTGGPNTGQSRQIDNTAVDEQLITVGDDFAVAPVAGNPFTITALEESGTGLSTFHTEDASVTTNNQFDTVLTDFGTAVTFVNATPDEAEYPYTWATGFAFGGGFP